ncbi:MAG: DUF4332 domain-containing protein [Caldilineaceae bacterium]|nr:DUF4332 domain-containing protein [Caldilineaceae bacterium]MCB9149987.1 DUF4332 domain-containing protein [Caldilineaceae bacterium]
MQFWVGLIAGLIIGWIIEWVIDWYFWRQESLQALLNEGDHSQADAESSDDVDQSLHQELVAARQEIAELRRQLNEHADEQLASPVSVGAADALVRVNGIGRVYAERLNAAGIFTFAELAQASPEQLREIIQPADWQAVDFDSWIEQAAVLAQETSTSAKGA